MISDVLISARSAEAMAAFYAGALAAEGEADGSIRFAGVAVRIAAPEPPPAPGLTKLGEGCGLRLLVFLGEADWLAGARARLAALGVDVSRYRETREALGMHVRDPDGNTVELATVLTGAQGQAARRFEAAAACRDPERSGARLARALGATIVKLAADKTILDLGARRLHLYKSQSEGPATAPPAPLGAVAGYAALGVGVADVAATIARCVAEGMTLPPDPPPPYAAVVRDEDGLTLGLRARGGAGPFTG